MIYLIRCETALEPQTDISNCIGIYQAACDVQAAHLIDHCSQIINNNWHKFNSSDFDCLSAPLLYGILKEKSSFPIHRAVESRREDVLLLAVADFSDQVLAVVDVIGVCLSSDLSAVNTISSV